MLYLKQNFYESPKNRVIHSSQLQLKISLYPGEKDVSRSYFNDTKQGPNWKKMLGGPSFSSLGYLLDLRLWLKMCSTF